MAPDGKLPRGLLLQQLPSINFAAKSFELSLALDKQNEKRPKKKSTKM
jgi:hypothetical protein